MQAYCTEYGVETRWENNMPGKDWIEGFTRRWSHRVKLKKPRAIKRSRSQECRK